jgi:hypothetical protein
MRHQTHFSEIAEECWFEGQNEINGLRFWILNFIQQTIIHQIRDCNF